MPGKFVSLIGSLALIIGSSSTGSGSSFHKVIQGNENAIGIKSTFPNTPLGDGGSALAMEHCSKYGKVATLDSNMVTNNIVGIRTYLCQ